MRLENALYENFSSPEKRQFFSIILKGWLVKPVTPPEPATENIQG